MGISNPFQQQQYQQVGQNLMNPNGMANQQYQQVGKALQNQANITASPEMWNAYLNYANQISTIFREPGSNLSHIIQLSIPLFQLAQKWGA